MKISTCYIPGLLIVEPKVFVDSRGYFFESYNKEVFQLAGITDEFIQDNQSLSQKNVLRGLHFQNPPFAQAKLVRVIKGAVLDIAVDIRKNSPTYGKYVALELNEQNKTMLYIPVGFAHGFLTLKDDTIFSYKCNKIYNKESEGSILWCDKTLNIQWNCKNPIISAKDELAPEFADFNSKFTF